MYTPQHPRQLPKTSNIPILQTIDNIIVQWLYIEGENSITTIWDEIYCAPPITWNITRIFTFKINSTLFNKMPPNQHQIIWILQKLYNNPTQYPIHGIDDTYIP